MSQIPNYRRHCDLNCDPDIKKLAIYIMNLEQYCVRCWGDTNSVTLQKQQYASLMEEAKQKWITYWTLKGEIFEEPFVRDRYQQFHNL